MLMAPPPGYTTTSKNQQNNQLLGKPGPAVGKPSPAMNPATLPNSLSPNPLMAPPPQIQNILNMLRRGAS